ncbi:MAG: MOFRL family protein, partial [Leptonema sp. (in: bacteria)]
GVIVSLSAELILSFITLSTSSSNIFLFSLSFSTSIEIASIFSSKILFSSFGTDGIDGPTDSAGGIVFCDSVQKINDLIKNHQEYSSAEDLLRNNDSYTALNLIDGLIKIGPTGTNLNDLSFFVYD